MHIDIWLDFSCPFCYIGKKRFEKALKTFKYQKEVTVSYKSYLLHPYMTIEKGFTSAEMLSKHKDITLDEANSIQDKVTKMAFEDDIVLAFDRLVPANTLHMHKLLKMIEDVNKQTHFINDIYQAYFEYGENIESLEILSKYGTKYGVDMFKIQQAYLSNDNLDLIKQDIDHAESIGVRGVPFFVTNHKYGMAGAQPTFVFLEMLEELYYESKPKNKSKTEYCVGDHCQRK